jgi:hypothetical protein
MCGSYGRISETSARTSRTNNDHDPTPLTLVGTELDLV